MSDALLSALFSLPGTTPCRLVVGEGPNTIDEVREAAGSTGVAYWTTRDCSERLGWTEATWATHAPNVPGSVKDRTWHLPADEARRYFVGRSRRKRSRRAPWKATSAQTARVGPEDHQERPVLRGRFASMVRREADVA